MANSKSAQLRLAREETARRMMAIADKYTPADIAVEYRARLTGCAWAWSRRIAAPRPVTRRALHVYLHEVAHVVLEHKHERPEYIQEYEAELWAFEVMKAEGVEIPPRCISRAKANVAYMIHRATRAGHEIEQEVELFAAA